MDDNFFDQVENDNPQGYHPHSTGEDDQNQQQEEEFDFGETTYQTPKIEHRYSNPLDQGHHGQQSYVQAALHAADNETTRKIQDEEQRIREELRKKSNAEYEAKEKRRQNGRKQLQAFNQRKEDETAERRRQNKDKQIRNKEETKKLNDGAGWKKVAANVSLKQSQKTGGKKDISRMREAINNKKLDESRV